MCIIIDADVAGDFVPPNDNGKPVLERIIKGLKVISGDDIRDQLLKCSFRPLYRQLILAGRIVEVEDSLIYSEIRAVERMKLKSNDSHIITLARVSGARLLYSRDKKLHDDFKNLALVPRPKGAVYQNSSHTHLLRQTRCC